MDLPRARTEMRDIDDLLAMEEKQDLPGWLRGIIQQLGTWGLVARSCSATRGGKS
jgi:hypothetical protein